MGYKKRIVVSQRLFTLNTITKSESFIFQYYEKVYIGMISKKWQSGQCPLAPLEIFCKDRYFSCVGKIYFHDFSNCFCGMFCFQWFMKRNIFCFFSFLQRKYR